MKPLRTIPTLLGDGFVLRPYDLHEYRDIPSLVQNINDSGIAERISRVPHPYTEIDGRMWMSNLRWYVLTAGECGNIWARIDFVIEVDGECAGSVAFINIDDHKAQMSFWLGSRFQGRGIVTNAVRLVTEFGFDTCGFLRIWGYTSDNNPASRKVLEKAGFLLEGIHKKEWSKSGRYHDSYVYAIVR